MKIGEYKKEGDSFVGTLKTTAINFVGVKIIPVTGKTKENAPDFVATYRGAEIGAGWQKEGEHGPFISLKFDQPGWASELNATLAIPKDGEGDTYILDWKRSKGAGRGADF